ncbi:hypothetical protein GMD78_12205 [Ornithinibacillus sp. L9]|uniref:Uncharacterized protein n=1 Tax=Ornithinibacillus caprae TaxID=2678566 RepID=A0A6N8FK99_9BACI|nr:hypothetical protein [Ornithinibacillus caprae]MUK89136.1 hypothetical protein [Ornithinibacillus caprae]
MKSNNRRNLKLSFSNIVMFFGLVGFIVVFFLPKFLSNTYIEQIGPLITATSFLIVFAGVLMQKEELSLQRKEFEETREVFKEQKITMELQRAETTFFNINAHRIQVINGMTFSKYEGMEAIKAFNSLIEKDTKNYIDDEINPYLIQYVNCIYSLINVVQLSTISRTQKDKLYLTLVLQMTLDEKKLINNYIKLDKNKESSKYKMIKEKVQEYF